MALKPKRKHGEGTIEHLRGKVRLVKMVEGRILKGPLMPTPAMARLAWNEKFLGPRRKKESAGTESFSRLSSELWPEEEPKNPHPLRAKILEHWGPVTRAANRRHWMASVPDSSIWNLRPIDLTADRLQKWIDTQPCAPRTKKNRLEVLRVICAWCGVDLPEIRLPMIKPARRETLADGQIGRFLALARNDRDRVLLRLLLLGLTRSEIAGLRHEQIYDGAIHVVAAVVEDEFGTRHEKDPKTARRIRTIPILDAWLREQLGGSRPGFVFFDRHPEDPRTSAWVTYRLGNLRKGTEFAKISPHSLRRTLATSFAKSNVPAKIGARILGHSVAVMLEIYAQVQDDVAADALATVTANWDADSVG